MLEDCGHVVEGSNEDWAGQPMIEERIAAFARDGVERLLECPQCSKPIVKTMRYRNIYIRFRKKINVINQAITGEMSRMKEMCSTRINLFRSDPTTSRK